jgi:hypothetical protein
MRTMVTVTVTAAMVEMVVMGMAEEMEEYWRW